MDQSFNNSFNVKLNQITIKVNKRIFYEIIKLQNKKILKTTNFNKVDKTAMLYKHINFSLS